MTSENIETGTTDLLASVDEGVLTITMNRPDALNALTEDMMRSFSAVLLNGELDPDVRAIVVTGSGKGFCAGGDVKSFAAMADDSAGLPIIDERIHKQRISQRAISGRLYKMPKPTVAVLPGAAAGAGLSIARACDLRIMSSRAVMTTAFARVGLSGDYGGTYFLSRLVGQAKAKELYFLSNRVDAQSALQLGLTNWVFDPEELEGQSRLIAQRLAKGPSVAYRYMKENLNRAVESGDADGCMDLEATHHVHCFDTQDHKSAAKAFVEKKEPVFFGK